MVKKKKKKKNHVLYSILGILCLILHLWIVFAVPTFSLLVTILWCYSLLCILHLINIQFVPSSDYYEQCFLWTFFYFFWWVHIGIFKFHTHLVLKLLGHRMCFCLNLVDTAKEFAKVIIPISMSISKNWILIVPYPQQYQNCIYFTL